MFVKRNNAMSFKSLNLVSGQKLSWSVRSLSGCYVNSNTFCRGYIRVTKLLLICVAEKLLKAHLRHSWRDHLHRTHAQRRYDDDVKVSFSAVAKTFVQERLNKLFFSILLFVKTVPEENNYNVQSTLEQSWISLLFFNLLDM